MSKRSNGLTRALRLLRRSRRHRSLASGWGALGYKSRGQWPGPRTALPTPDGLSYSTRLLQAPNGHKHGAGPVSHGKRALRAKLPAQTTLPQLPARTQARLYTRHRGWQSRDWSRGFAGRRRHPLLSPRLTATKEQGAVRHTCPRPPSWSTLSGALTRHARQQPLVEGHTGRACQPRGRPQRGRPQKVSQGGPCTAHISCLAGAGGAGQGQSPGQPAVEQSKRLQGQL